MKVVYKEKEVALIAGASLSLVFSFLLWDGVPCTDLKMVKLTKSLHQLMQTTTSVDLVITGQMLLRDYPKCSLLIGQLIIFWESSKVVFVSKNAQMVKIINT